MIYQFEDICRMLGIIAEKMKQDLDVLAELDGLSGDGDLGESIEKSANAIIHTVGSCDYKNIGELFMKVSIAMNKAAPSTLGTLLAGAVMAVAKEMKGKETLEEKDVIHIPKTMAESIKEKGKAGLGDKTILDALIPMSEVIENEFIKGADVRMCFHQGAAAAVKGAESTIGMIPKAGRAQWIGERVKQYPDGGAVFCAKVAQLFIAEE